MNLSESDKDNEHIYGILIFDKHGNVLINIFLNDCPFTNNQILRTVASLLSFSFSSKVSLKTKDCFITSIKSFENSSIFIALLTPGFIRTSIILLQYVDKMFHHFFNLQIDMHLASALEILRQCKDYTFEDTVKDIPELSPTKGSFVLFSGILRNMLLNLIDCKVALETLIPGANSFEESFCLCLVSYDCLIPIYHEGVTLPNSILDMIFNDLNNIEEKSSNIILNHPFTVEICNVEVYFHDGFLPLCNILVTNQNNDKTNAESFVEYHIDRCIDDLNIPRYWQSFLPKLLNEVPNDFSELFKPLPPPPSNSQDTNVSYPRRFSRGSKNKNMEESSKIEEIDPIIQAIQMQKIPLPPPVSFS
eukprot:TRINITY_DN1747_c0_g2_i1.p1 TRINITY_DN1747_c0_g2~~TRINITY_DN1747_c0_g2_i1.p1  ORF type:complete len:362 (+),score=90.91 TRINITY_DN1747_c0_g2_i1:44-1129(+)